MLVKALANSLLESINSVSSTRDTNHWHVKRAVARHRLQRRDYLLKGEVAGYPKDDKRI